jgi:hypothetical protein
LLAALTIGAVAAPPQQPIPFSHKAHAGDLKLPCKMCHPNPDRGEAMRIAATSVCMQCHAAIKADSPAIQKLATFDKSGRGVPWVRVYQVPGYVFFSHRSHLNARNTCDDCHGPVAEREQIEKERNISMGACMECHRLKKASIDCTFCHEQQN